MTPPKLNLYADHRYLPEAIPHVPLLYPFWGMCNDDPVQVNQGVYDRYLTAGADFFQLTDLADAQFAVLPFAWEQTTRHPELLALADDLAKAAADAGKPVIVFYRSDYEERLPLNNAFIFRTSLTRGVHQPNEFILPAWSADFADSYCAGQIPLRDKKARPVVGFCGDVSSGSTFLDRLGRALGEHPAIWNAFKRLGIDMIPHPGSRIRLHALRALSRTKDIDQNFVIRHGHWNNAVYRGSVRESALVESSRQEYVENMLGSDYILCARGKGNYSYRLYETLSCGRIPIFINTDPVLPYEKWIEWRQYCVWIEENELSHIADKVAAFHERLSSEQFQDLQYACRRLWLDWLSPAGYFANFYRHFV